MVKGINSPPPRHPSLTGIDTTKPNGTTARQDTTPKSPGTSPSPTRASTDLQANPAQKRGNMSQFRASIDSFRRQASATLSDAGTSVSTTLSHAKDSVKSINVGETLSHASTRLSENLTNASTSMASTLSQVQTQVEKGIETVKTTADVALTHAAAFHGVAEQTLSLANTMMGLSESANKTLTPIAASYPQNVFLQALKTGLDGLNAFKPGLETAGITMKNAGAMVEHLTATYVPSKPSAPPPGEKTPEATP